MSARASHLPGMTQWLAQLPAGDSAKVWAAIDALARQQQQDDPSRTLDQHRADALVDLVLGNATIQASLTIAIPISATGPGAGTGAGTGGEVPEAFGGPAPGASAPGCVKPDSTGPDGTASGAAESGGMSAPAGEDGGLEARQSLGQWLWTRLAPQDPSVGWVEVPGIGVIPAGMVLAMAGDLGTKITRMLIDPQTGTTVEAKATGYRPPAGIARFVRLRDGTCRFPNCHRRAQSCEIDHVVAFPAGPTAVTNLICVCKHHHRLKHATAWTPRLSRDGTVTWTDPYGQDWLTHPSDHRQSAVA